MSFRDKRGTGQATNLMRRVAGHSAALALSLMATGAQAQDEIRYSWFEISYVAQDVDRMGSQISFLDPLEPQLVEIHAKDGNGIKFRGSVGTWNNLYAFVDFASSDIDVSSVVTVISSGLMAEGEDEFDYTSIRGGIGLRFPLRHNIDIYGEVSYDSLDLDFGSLVGEDFDTDSQDVGGALGIRGMISDDLELRAWGRYTNVGDVDLDLASGSLDSDVLAGIGFGYTIIQGLSITGDYESGEFSSWNLGFRLDLSED
jgi:hypothetical protein